MTNLSRLWRACIAPIARDARNGPSHSRVSEGVDARGETRQLARDGISVQHALCRRAVQLGLSDAKGRLRGFLVAAADRGLDPLDKSSHPAHPGAVDRGACLGLAQPFLGRFMMRHDISSARESAAI